MSKKASMNALTYDVTPWTGPVLTKHARKRCTQRHINPLHVGVDSSTKAIVSNNVVLTVYKRTTAAVIDGAEHIRRTNRPHHVPEDVAIHLNKYSDRSTKFAERTNYKYTKKEKKKKKKKTESDVKNKKARKRGGRSGIRCKTTQKATRGQKATAGRNLRKKAKEFWSLYKS